MGNLSEAILREEERRQCVRDGGSAKLLNDIRGEAFRDSAVSIDPYLIVEVANIRALHLLFSPRKSGLIRRSNFFGSAVSNSRLSLSSLARCFALMGNFFVDFFRGTPEA